MWRKSCEVDGRPAVPAESNKLVYLLTVAARQLGHFVHQKSALLLTKLNE